MLTLFVPRRNTSSRTQTRTQIVSWKDSRTDLPPTMANYRMVADQSLEKLDELLSQQANRNLSPVAVLTID
jgi:hypothetical protein